MHKKIILTAVSTALLASSLPVLSTPYSFAESGALGFKDTTTHWGKTYIEKLQKEGYAVGSNGYFKPNEALKTEDFLIMALKVVDPTAKELKASEGQSYYEPFVTRAVEIGLIKTENDEVAQFIERTMPRELAIQVVDRAFTKMGQNIEADQGLSYKFKDFKIINDINREAVLRAYELGIIKGSNGNFEPKNPLTRAEAAVLIAKLMDKGFRDNVSVSRNPKTYDEISQWYIDAFEKTVEKRSVLIEKKAGGVLNSGDVDYTERAFYYKNKWNNWWTDQQYEDEILGMASRNEDIITSSLAGSESKRMEDVFGTYYVRNGEIAYIEYDGEYNQKAYKNYSHPMANNNRVFYDLMKYSSQFAKLSEKHASIIYNGGATTVSFCEDTYNVNYSELDFEFLADPEIDKKYYVSGKFLPMLAVRVKDDYFSQYKPVAQQILTRVYGEKTGTAIFKEIETWTKGRDVKSSGEKYIKINGVHVYLDDLDYANPRITIGFPK